VAFDAALGLQRNADGAWAREFFETKPARAGQVFATFHKRVEIWT
jgi:hypothetical protein